MIIHYFLHLTIFVRCRIIRNFIPNFGSETTAQKKSGAPASLNASRDAASGNASNAASEDASSADAAASGRDAASGSAAAASDAGESAAAACALPKRRHYKCPHHRPRKQLLNSRRRFSQCLRHSKLLRSRDLNFPRLRRSNRQ